MWEANTSPTSNARFYMRSYHNDVQPGRFVIDMQPGGAFRFSAWTREEIVHMHVTAGRLSSWVKTLERWVAHDRRAEEVLHSKDVDSVSLLGNGDLRIVLPPDPLDEDEIIDEHMNRHLITGPSEEIVLPRSLAPFLTSEMRLVHERFRSGMPLIQAFQQLPAFASGVILTSTSIRDLSRSLHTPRRGQP